MDYVIRKLSKRMDALVKESLEYRAQLTFAKATAQVQVKELSEEYNEAKDELSLFLAKNSEPEPYKQSKNVRKILTGEVGEDGFFKLPSPDFTSEDELRWAKNRMRSTRIAQYADKTCGLSSAYDPNGAYLCAGRKDGISSPCNMMNGASECLIRINPIPNPHETSCMWWEITNAGDPEGRLCPKGKLDDDRLDFGPTTNPLGFGCIRCEYGQGIMPKPDSEGRTRWCKVKDHTVESNSCCADNDPIK